MRFDLIVGVDAALLVDRMSMPLEEETSGNQKGALQREALQMLDEACVSEPSVPAVL
jgi:hypothetical protein